MDAAKKLHSSSMELEMSTQVECLHICMPGMHLLDMFGVSVLAILSYIYNFWYSYFLLAELNTIEGNMRLFL